MRTYDNVFECFHRSVGFVNLVQAWDLNGPPYVVGVELVVDDPSRKFVPLVWFPAVDADSPLYVLRYVIITEFRRKSWRAHTWYLLCSKSGRGFYELALRTTRILTSLMQISGALRNCAPEDGEQPLRCLQCGAEREVVRAKADARTRIEAHI